MNKECKVCKNVKNEDKMLCCTNCGWYFCDDDCSEVIKCPEDIDGFHSSN